MEWWAEAILVGISKKVKIVQTSKAQNLNWWWFGFELYLLITEEDSKELEGTIELPEEERGLWL